MRRRVEVTGWGVLAAAIACGCGGSHASGSPDASLGGGAGNPGSDASDSASDAQSCVLDAASLNALAVNADGSDTPCETCIVQNCGAELTACSSDCSCDPQLLALIACATDGGSAIACGEPLAMSDASTAQALAQCVGGFIAGGTGLGCLLQCGIGQTSSEAGAVEAGAPEASVPEAGAPMTDGASDLTDGSASD